MRRSSIRWGSSFAAAFAPVILNVVNISALVPLAILTLEDKDDPAFWVAIATMLGGIAQLVLVYVAIRRAKFVPRIRLPRFDGEVRRFWVLAVPAILAGGITQINISSGTIIASGANEVMSIIYNADRLYQLPLGIIGIAIGTVLLPELSRHLSAGRDAEARASQSQSLALSMLLSMPATGALIALAEPTVRVLFERAPSVRRHRQCRRGAVAFPAGIPAYVLIRVLQPGFFSRKGHDHADGLCRHLGGDQYRRVACPTFKHVGIALATTIAAWVNVAMPGVLSRPPRSLRHQRRRMAPAMIAFATPRHGPVLYGSAWRWAFRPHRLLSAAGRTYLVLCILGAALSPPRPITGAQPSASSSGACG